MEKLFVAANAYVGEKRQTKMSCARYGNVLGSRGSVAALFKKQKEAGKITITDKRMTRFWITLEQGVEFVIKCLDMMHGGEVFVPKIPSMKIMDFSEAVASGCKIEYTGIRPGEKIHECLLTEDESRHALEFKDFFIIEPEHQWWQRENHKGGKAVKEGFRYASDNNTDWLTIKGLQQLIEKSG